MPKATRPACKASRRAECADPRKLSVAQGSRSNSIGDAIISTDIAGNVTYLNPIAESMTGWSQEEALNRPLEQVLRIVQRGQPGARAEPAGNGDLAR